MPLPLPGLGPWSLPLEEGPWNGDQLWPPPRSTQLTFALQRQDRVTKVTWGT